MSLSVEDRYDLITRNLVAVSDGEKLRSILKERELKIYWGLAVAEKLDLSYFVAVSKIADFLRAGANVTVLLADLHTFLDNRKSSWDALPLRCDYYESAIKVMCKSIGINTDGLRFVRGTDFQLSREYTLDAYKLSSLVSTEDARLGAEEVVAQVEHPLLSALLYPSLQALDEEHLKVDVHFGTVKQKKIFEFAEKYLPVLGYEKRIHLTSPSVLDLSGGKVTLPEDERKVDILESMATLKNKMKKAFCEKGNVENNGLLSLLKHVIFPLLMKADEKFVITRSKNHGGDIVFERYDVIEDSFGKKDLHPGDLKVGVETYINKLLEPIRKEFEEPNLRQIVEKAFPVAAARKKGGSTTAVPNEEATPSRLDMRIGKIVEVSKHPDADGLYVEKIDVGEGSLRTIVSGLVNYVPIEEMQDALVLVLCNLKPAKLRGIESKGMLLCANLAPKEIEIVCPPGGTPAGERVYVEGYEEGTPDDVLNPKKKVWEKLQVDLTTNEDCVCQWQGKKLFTKSGGLLTCKSMKNAPVK
ncbi:tyrosine--tRNA ligase, cytoplasmic-like [Photinus pyralis]|uniref:tyrosine--tRNA ligase, cytoplasmic-like n=1 Tax=Photinus pyralis TaxID=7054 RepID=UPI0012676D65|nr:tyrosine--tRNA ligase, cytoplasmic-like [Photinus pyralis]